MTTNVEDLRRQLREAEEAAAAIPKAELAAIPRVHVYTIQWLSKHVFRCERQWSPETLAEFNAWQVRHPRASAGFDFNHEGRRREGMKYLLIGSLLTYLGGGTMVLRTRSDFDHEPVELTDEQRDSLLAGIVPDSLKTQP